MNIIRKTIENQIRSGPSTNNLSIGIKCVRPITYKSAIALETLYPNSSLKLTTPQPPKQDEPFTGHIPMDKLEVTYSRSTGPGGQNVNKVNTKVDLRFHLASATWLSEDIRSNLGVKLQNKITNEGYLVFRSDLTRSQQLNVADCLEKLRSVIRATCAVEPTKSPETEERLRKRRERAARERLFIKRERSAVKAERRNNNL